MTSTSIFVRWEKDPFFAVADEVQESADRMESIYRRWIYERKTVTKTTGGGEDASGEFELRRELHAALGTAKWQLEEFDRASRLSNDARPVDDDARIRHSQFTAAIGNQILEVEKSLRDLEAEEGRTPLAWVRLDEGECDELAMFLSGPQFPEERNKPSSSLDPGSRQGHKLPPFAPSSAGGRRDTKGCNADIRIDLPKRSISPTEMGSWDNREEKKHGHRRAASVGADLGTWKNPITDEDCPGRSLDERSDARPPPRVLSFSGLAMVAEATWRTKWVKSGFRKWRGGDQQHVSEESIPSQSNQFSRDLNECYTKCKSCLGNWGDESYEKQFYGCIGAFQRQLQRSQYQIQYGRPIQLIFWLILAFLLIVVFTLQAI